MLIALFKNTRFQSGYFLILFTAAVTHIANADTFKVSRTTLLDPCGKPVVLRGVNAGIAFPSDPTGKSLSEISQTGANAVRLTFRWLHNRNDPQSVAVALQKAVENHMLAMPSLWDATSDWEQLPFTVDFWTQPEMVAVLRQYEDMIVLNIANEAGSSNVTHEEFRYGYLQAIKKIRKAGLHMPLVIDAAGSGRDESYIIQNAQYLIFNDPDRKLLFSWHPWDIGQPQSRYKTTIDSAIQYKIPLLLGEVSSIGSSEEGEIDYRYLMQYASEKNIGWLWWWWSSGNAPDAHALTVDGIYGHWANVGEEVVSTSPYGISATSKRTDYLNNRTCLGSSVTATAPKAPQKLNAVAVKGAELSLSWTDASSNEKNFDIEIWDEATQKWKLIKVVDKNTIKTNIGAGSEFIYSMDSPREPSLNYSTTYKIRVGAYASSDAVSYSAPVTVTTNPDPRICSNGDGLMGEYFLPFDFMNGDWQGMVRTDAQINFAWGNDSPDPADPTAPKDHFAAAWQGEIEPQFDAEYTFYTNSDDFARVWIDGTLVIDNWKAFANGWAQGKIQLTGGVKHSILVEYEEWDGNARMELHWASNQLKRELVPQCRLFSPPPVVE